ncbi:hypothetical protein M2351_006292 [Azospirillum canadense]|nr:hypothetical protein [Azospirillum canadense]
MCHSSERWPYRSRRQADRTETLRRNDEVHRKAETVRPSAEPILETGKDEQIRPKKELERVP